MHCLFLHPTVFAGDWVMLIYKNGTAYGEFCGKEMRKAYIMISCNRKVDVVRSPDQRIEM